MYAHALDTAPADAAFVDYDALLADPAGALERLARDARLDADAAARLVGQASRLRAPTSAPVGLDALDPGLVDEARALHARLVGRARG